MKKRTLLLSLSFLLMASVGRAQKVTWDYDSAANFKAFKNYMWLSGTPVKNQLMDERILKAIDTQMAAKGLRKVDSSGNPDLAITYHAAVSTQTQFNTTNIGGYGPWRYGWGATGMSTTTVENIPIGELLVDIGIVKDKKLIWRGVARDTLSDNPEKNAKKINKAVEKMFKKYPPPQK